MKQRVKISLIVLVVGVLINIALAITKMYVGLSTNSLCILLDAMNSTFDIITCIVTIIAFAVLLSGRTSKAPFGYGRVEYLAGFIVAVVSVVVGGLFLFRSINRLAMPEPVWFSTTNCVLIAVAIPIKLGLGLFYYFVNKKVKSKAIAALVLDSFLDTGITSTSLISFAVSANVDYAVDAILGIVMSVVVIVVAIIMVASNIKTIVVGDDAKEEKQAIVDVCNENGKVSKIEKINLHDYGYASKVGDVELEYREGTLNEEIDAINHEIEQKVEEKTGANIKVFGKAKD